MLVGQGEDTAALTGQNYFHKHYRSKAKSSLGSYNAPGSSEQAGVNSSHSSAGRREEY